MLIIFDYKKNIKKNDYCNNGNCTIKVLYVLFEYNHILHNLPNNCANYAINDNWMVNIYSITVDKNMLNI